MKVGYSLSFCVRDILAGTVALEDVKIIHAQTAWRTEADREFGVSAYAATYWKADPDRARVIVDELLRTGRLDQPRRRGEPVYELDGTNHWVEEVVA